MPAFTGLQFYPINSTLDESGALISLYPLLEYSPGLSKTNITPPAYDPSTMSLSGFKIIGGTVSATAVIAMGFSNLAAVTASGGATYVMQDAVTYALVPTNASDSPIAGWVYGAGLRVVGRAENVQSSVVANLPGLAAMATLNAAASSFEFTTIGLPISIAIPACSGLIIQSMQGLTLGTMTAIQQAQTLVNQAIGANASQMQPQIMGVWFNSLAALQALMAGYGYSLRTVRKGMVPATVLQEKPPHGLPAGISFDPGLVDSVATAIGMTDLAIAPTSDQSHIAYQLDMPGKTS